MLRSFETSLTSLRLMDQLPTEILLELLDYLDGPHLIRCSFLNKKFHTLIRTQWLLERGRTNFVQQGSDLHKTIYDRVQEVDMDYGRSIMYLGVRKQGDRCRVTKVPLECLVGYFEVTLLEQIDPSLPMRIGVVEQCWPWTHPPGCLPNSIGYARLPR